jgi:hypothetical protein
MLPSLTAGMVQDGKRGGQVHFRGVQVGRQCNIHRAAKIGTVPCDSFCTLQHRQDGVRRFAVARLVDR